MLPHMLFVNEVVQTVHADTFYLRFVQFCTFDEILQAMTAGTGVTFRSEGESVILIPSDDKPKGIADVLRLAREVVTMLGILGREAERAIPPLEILVTHEDTQDAARAKAALRQIRDG